MFAVQDLDFILRKTLIKLLVRLTRKFEWIPSALLVDDVEAVSPEPIFAGGFADIFVATCKGQTVALKRFRDFLPGHDSDAVDKACHGVLFFVTITDTYTAATPRDLRVEGTDASECTSVSRCRQYLISISTMHGLAMDETW
jgi:hypothetical protein